MSATTCRRSGGLLLLSLVALKYALETCSTRFGAGPPSFPSVAARSSSSILQSFIGAVVFRSVHRGASLDDARTYVRPRGAKKGFLYVRTYLVLCVVGVPAVAGG